MKTPSIVFFGTPVLSVWVLEELEARGMMPSLVVTAPDKPAGRGKRLTPSPVKVWAQERGIPILMPASLKTPHDASELVNGEWNLFIVVAYGFLLPAWLLALPRHGTINLHPSLLPKLRGPSPVRSAILEDKKEDVGVTVMLLDENMDHGPLLAQASVELYEWPVRGRVLDELLFREGGRLLAEIVAPHVRGELEAQAQDHDAATYCRKFKKTDGLLDLEADPYKNYLKFCAFDGWPGTYFFDEAGRRIKITDASFEGGNFIVRKIVPEGGKEITYP